MENTKESIRALIDEAVRRLYAKISENLSDMNFTDIVRTTHKTVNDLGARLVEQIVGIVDDKYNALRNKHEIILRHTKTRKMVSGMGELNLKRRLYYDKTAARYFFAVDELLNIEKFSRIEGELKTKLINDATLTSYGKASKLAGNCVSRQTVCNLVKRVPENVLQVQASGEFRKVDKIFIEADEDHIHLNTGKSADVKLVYVHEGWREVCHGRTELVNPKYFASMANAQEIWQDVQDYVYDQYVHQNAEIHLSGDGAPWIKSALEAFPKAEYHLDKFHVYKWITDIVPGSTRLRRSIIGSLRLGDLGKVNHLFMQRFAEMKNYQQRHRVLDHLAYINNNFSDIDLDSIYGCSAEGHVSHVLSSRLSSRPMAWSKSGAEKMSKLRAFYYNGGDFENLRRTRNENTEENLKDSKNWPIREYNSDGSIPQGTFRGPSAVLEEIKNVLLRLSEC